MPYSKPSPLKSFIDEPIDPIRINGLIGEDRIRTTKMFLLGTVSNRPTHPIDISASADLIQGLPTHVKIKKIVPLKKEDKDLPFCKRRRYSIDMACAHEFWKLYGDHRLLIMFYHMQTHIDLKTGKPFEVMCFVEIVEIILTESVFKHLRGNVKTSEVGRIKADILSWRGSYKTKEEAEEEAEKVRARTQIAIDHLNDRPGAGIMTLSRHIDTGENKKTKLWGPSNKRIQPTLPLLETIDFCETQGPYRNHAHPGSQDQPMVQIYHEEFYGLELPWMTRAKDAITPAKGWSKLERENDPKRGKKPPQLDKAEEAKLHHILQHSAPPIEVPVAGGSISIIRHINPATPNEGHERQWRSIWLERGSDEFTRNLTWACKILAIKHIESLSFWFSTYEKACKLVASLSSRDFSSDYDIKDCLVEMDGLPRRWRFQTLFGPYIIRETDDKRYYIAPDSRFPQQREILERRMSIAFNVFGLLERGTEIEGIVKDGKIAWYAQPSCVRDAARAIIDYTNLENGGQARSSSQ